MFCVACCVKDGQRVFDAISTGWVWKCLFDLNYIPPAPHDQDWTLLRGMIITLIDEVKNLDVSPDVNDSIEDVNDFWSRAPPLLL